jgi:protein-S-isoprenylcysteine O-methyltransferase Ste14
MNNKKLILYAITKFVFGFGILGLLIFLTAGDTKYFNAWLFLGTLSVCMFVFGLFLYIKDKELLEKRLRSKEKQREQSFYNIVSGISFLLIFVISSLDYRLKWSNIPTAIVIVALVIMIFGFLLFVVTLMQNRYASRTIEIQNSQKVIDTGFYSVVRHPMYTSMITMNIAIPIALGSYFGLIPVVLFIIGIVFRLKNEEAFLCKELEGYSDYMKRVKYRIIPLLW